MISVTFTSSCCYLGAGLICYVLCRFILDPIFLGSYTSTLRDLPGPPRSSWIFGNLKELLKDGEFSGLFEEWAEEYGSVMRFKVWFNSNRLYTVDTRALNHVLSHSTVYQKPDLTRFSLSQVLGKGVLVVEGEQHRQQRRILNPAFGPGQIREFTEIFNIKAIQLRDTWITDVTQHDGSKRVDVLKGLTQTTLDVIGLAGFNYDFQALNPGSKPNELHSAFDVMFQSLQSFSIVPILQAYIPPLRLLPDIRTRRINHAQKVMRDIGLQRISERKAEILQHDPTEKGGQDNVHGRDLLTLLIKANMDESLPDSQRLSDEDMLAQIPTFLIAGHETTSNAIAWCLYALAQTPCVQEKLREELWRVATDHPTMEELNMLPYLDAVIRETMRVYPPAPASIRVAVEDDVAPLSAPYIDVHGKAHDSIRIPKGSAIIIPILAVNRSKEIWGDNAFEFRPERWESVPEAVQGIPGVWANLMSFLGGPRSCIGYRFAIVEMKALIFALVRAFEFDLAVPKEDIDKTTAFVQRPIVRSEREKGNQMPLKLRPHVRI